MILRLINSRSFYVVAISIFLSLGLVAAIASGATTISTNISTGGTLTVSGASTLTGVVTFGDVATLDNSATNPSSTAEGSIYYDTGDRVIKLYNGTSWLTVASSTDADGGLVLTDPGVRFNSVATGYMALGTSTLPIVSGDSGDSLLFLNATTSDTVPLTIQGWTGQTGDLIKGLSDVNAEVFAIDHSGNASTTMLSTTGIHVDALVVSGYATTSGSTGNFATEGTLSVTGTSALTGAVTLTGALTVNGNTTLGNAVGDTVQAIAGTFSVGGYATTTVDLDDVFATSTIGYNTEVGGGGALGVGTTTPGTGAQKFGVEGDVWIGSAATTTLSLHTSVATGGTCLQMVASDGNLVRIFVDNGDALVVEVGACSGGGN